VRCDARAGQRQRREKRDSRLHEGANLSCQSR
jgi:hypothetical protein